MRRTPRARSQHARPSGAPTTKASVTLGADGGGAPSYAVTAVSISQTALGAPLDLSFTTSALPLLDGIFQAENAAAAIPVLTLSVRDGADGSPVTFTFSGPSVSSLAEKRSGPLSGTAALTVPSP